MSRPRCCAASTKPKLAGAAEVVVWGSGTPRREFLYVDDLADASVHLLRHYSGDSHVNVGAGYDVTVAEFAEHVKRCVGFAGRIVYDRSRADGTPRKLLDCGRLPCAGGLEDRIGAYRWEEDRPICEYVRRSSPLPALDAFGDKCWQVVAEDRPALFDGLASARYVVRGSGGFFAPA
jgi:hypothetical protein